jgi:hypothetical protein
MLQLVLNPWATDFLDLGAWILKKLKIALSKILL